MKQRPRIYYTETDKALMWDRWQKGESLNSIAGLFGRGHSSIQRILAETGGIRPLFNQLNLIELQGLVEELLFDRRDGAVIVFDVHYRGFDARMHLQLSQYCFDM